MFLYPYKAYKFDMHSILCNANYQFNGRFSIRVKKKSGLVQTTISPNRNSTQINPLENLKILQAWK